MLVLSRNASDAVITRAEYRSAAEVKLRSVGLLRRLLRHKVNAPDALGFWLYTKLVRAETEAFSDILQVSITVDVVAGLLGLLHALKLRKRHQCTQILRHGTSDMATRATTQVQTTVTASATQAWTCQRTLSERNVLVLWRNDERCSEQRSGCHTLAVSLGRSRSQLGYVQRMPCPQRGV